MSKKPIECKEGELDLAEIVADFTNTKDVDYVRACLQSRYPALFNRKRCPNCGMSMVIQTYKADLHNALFLLAMGRAVSKNLKKGENFTEANKVHIPTLGIPDAVRKRETQCDYVGNSEGY